MQGIAIVMPHQDLTITEATVVRWLKPIGSTVACGESVVEVETEKAISEIESPANGVLIQTLAR